MEGGGADQASSLFKSYKSSILSLKTCFAKTTNLFDCLKFICTHLLIEGVLRLFFEFRSWILLFFSISIKWQCNENFFAFFAWKMRPGPYINRQKRVWYIFRFAKIFDRKFRQIRLRAVLVSAESEFFSKQ